MRLPRRRVRPGSALPFLVVVVVVLRVLVPSGSRLLAQESTSGRSRVSPAATGTAQRPAARPAAGTTPRPAAEPAAPATPAAREQPERPQGQALKVEPLPPELMQLLQDWETSSSKITAMYGEHDRYVYNATFAIEKRGRGRLYYEAPDKGRYEVEPMSIPKGAVSKKVDKNGKPFELKPHEAELWICTGTEIIKVNEDRREFERAIIPPEDRGQNMVNGPLPFLFGMKAEQARRRYFLEIVKEDENLNEVWIKAEPREARDAALWSTATIILSRKTFLPRAVLLVDTTGKETTVHSFTKLQPKKGFDGIAALINGNPFQFDVKGYQQIIYDGNGADLPQSGRAGEPRNGVPGDTSQKGRPTGTASAPDSRKQTAVPGSGTQPAAAKVGATTSKPPVRTAGTGSRTQN